MTPLLTDIAYALVLGVALSVGIALVASVTPRWGAPTLSRRIAPYLRDVTDPRGIVPVSIEPRWRAAVRVAGAHSVSPSVQRRLRQAGWSIDAAAFRGRQLAWAIAGVAIGGMVVVAVVLAGHGGPALAVVPILFGVAAVVACDLWLSHAAAARVARIEEELPTVLEFLALGLSAGEGMLDSLRRVGSVGAGELTAAIGEVVVAAGTGSSLSDALGRLGRELDVPALSRAVDQLTAAIDRGAPLAQVLQAQAADAREDAKRRLIESAGRKEIAMLVPLVFLILPLSVVFAVFPGIFMLRLGIG
ncbi:type II secretion system F family protein [Microbacterium awajiense]|uniref:Type II secretion system F family protein n=1 Tax=Microbacterium awajiense TaxID=415214 RepID=A0ABP7A9Z2_9MICO